MSVLPIVCLVLLVAAQSGVSGAYIRVLLMQSNFITEVSQIRNVYIDVGVNLGVKSHPVGSSTPQKFQFQGKEQLKFVGLCFISFFFILPLIFETKVQNSDQKDR